MSIWPWRRKPWSPENVNLWWLWKKILKHYKKHGRVNGLNASNVGSVLSRHWTFEGYHVYYEADKILKVYEQMGLAVKGQDTSMSLIDASGVERWVCIYHPVKEPS